jgi:predicted TPR repeat methyltransferase
LVAWLFFGEILLFYCGVSLRAQRSNPRKIGAAVAYRRFKRAEPTKIASSQSLLEMTGRFEDQFYSLFPSGVMPHSLDQHFFDELYQREADPWRFETSEYEHAKYARTVAALPHAHYANAFEIGCSLGVLTERLAERCEKLLATDVSAAPLERARVRLAGAPHVEFRQAALPQDFPHDRSPFDLIVASEVLYFLVSDDFERAVDLLIENLTTGGHLLLVHWTPYVAEFPQTGDAVHEAILTRPGLRAIVSERAETYRLDLLEKQNEL